MFGVSVLLYGSFIMNASNRHSTSLESSSDSLWSLNINADTTERNDNIAERHINVC